MHATMLSPIKCIKLCIVPFYIESTDPNIVL